ncbi:hypothetical protein [Halarchaeum nitratireducens]|uniref:Uncharacterized protein n=1 Tax=Halarchaeum nitratireducens TaxID=489913 RepID=A0A830GDU3_9EURY|nr:hypothetical protein [Halarchaeum nitratireducens]GGN18525.1 hypothetical protein GCM10009021_19390 [Halarchaeum nitratireducens]
MSEQTRCWSCQCYLAEAMQDEDGYYCPNCRDEPNAVELRDNGWAFNGQRWVRAELVSEGERGVVGDVIHDDDRAMKALRESVGHGKIEGYSYAITQNLADATIAIEFDGVSVEYAMSDFVTDAYERAVLADVESEVSES